MFIACATLSPLNERPEFDTDLFSLSRLDHYLAFAEAGSLFGLAHPRGMIFVCILVVPEARLYRTTPLADPRSPRAREPSKPKARCTPILVDEVDASGSIALDG